VQCDGSYAIVLAIVSYYVLIFKAVPQHIHAGEGGRGIIYNSFTTSALDGGELSASRFGHALVPGKGPPVPIVQEAGSRAGLDTRDALIFSLRINICDR
jgi:hypothetical protein